MPQLLISLEEGRPPRSRSSSGDTCLNILVFAILVCTLNGEVWFVLKQWSHSTPAGSPTPPQGSCLPQLLSHDFRKILKPPRVMGSIYTVSFTSFSWPPLTPVNSIFHTSSSQTGCRHNVCGTPFTSQYLIIPTPVRCSSRICLRIPPFLTLCVISTLLVRVPSAACFVLRLQATPCNTSLSFFCL